MKVHFLWLLLLNPADQHGNFAFLIFFFPNEFVKNSIKKLLFYKTKFLLDFSSKTKIHDLITFDSKMTAL